MTRRPRPQGRASAAIGSGHGRATMTGVPTVLVVDDAPDIVRLTRDYLEHAGFVVLTASDGRAALWAEPITRLDSWR